MLCKNCGFEFEGTFCSNCGSKRIVEIPSLKEPFYMEIGGISFDVNLVIRVYGLGFRKIGAYSYMSQKCGLPASQIEQLISPVIDKHICSGENAGLMNGVKAQGDLSAWERIHLKEIQKVTVANACSTKCSDETKEDGAYTPHQMVHPQNGHEIKPVVADMPIWQNRHRIKVCVNCGDRLIENAIKCPTCRNKDLVSFFDDEIESIQSTIMNAPNPKGIVKPKSEQPITPPPAVTLAVEKPAEEKIHKMSKRELKVQAHNSGQACCPKCGSVSLSANKKGFGVGKAVVGAWAVGPVGLIAGNLNAKKVWVTCLNCGKRWKM